MDLKANWTPEVKITALGNAEAKLADAKARGDDCGVYYWKERVETYRRQARRNVNN